MNKKLLLAAAIAFCSASGLRAQTYYPMLADSNTWAVYGDVIPLIPENHGGPAIQMMSMSGYVKWVKDTIVDSLNYKMFYSREHEWNSTQWSLLREDTATQQVFLLSAGDTAERIIYDFSLNAGDSIYLQFMYQSASELVSGWWHVDSTNMYMIDAGLRKALYLSHPSNPLHNGQPRFIQWIESVGCNLSPLYLDEYTGEIFSGIESGMPPGCTQNSHFYSTTCAWHDSLRIFNSECWEAVRQQTTFWYVNGDSCVFNLMGGIYDPISNINDIALFPNPAKETTTLVFVNVVALEFSITITNVLGQHIKTVAPYSWFAKGRHSMDVDLSELSPGIYSINLLSEYGVKTVKMIVQ